MDDPRFYGKTALSRSAPWRRFLFHLTSSNPMS
jgi:hypothetical protein